MTKKDSTITKTQNGRNKLRVSRGPLHDVLTSGLPDLKDSVSKVCNLHMLADELKMSPQGVYKWFKPGRKNRLSKDTVEKLIRLSSLQITGEADFTPLIVEDLWQFVSS